MKILAVDDEPIFHALLANSLAECGYQDIKFAMTGQNALDKISNESSPFDCFLLDIKMEHMDGIELCRRIRALPQHRHTPIIMISSMSEKSFIDSAFQSGASDYITKPLDRLELKARMKMVKSLLNERSHVGAMSQQIKQAETSMGAGHAIDEPIVLNEARGLTPYFSLENYLFKLGRARLFSSAAIGFHIENAEEIYQRSTGLEYADILTDVADVISDALKTELHLLAHAGNGDFVAVVPLAASRDTLEVQQAVDAGLAAFFDIYVSVGRALPRVKIGTSAPKWFLSFARPTRMLESSIRNARLAGSQGHGGPNTR
jgi:CheY-like chemotaxis protein